MAIPAFDGNVEPLISTQWDQDAPYNELCPIIDGEHVWAGCVATAMAQLMNYYEWPQQGIGSHTYTCIDPYGWELTLSADFGSTTYDWDNMADIYDGSNSQAETSAVATLTYHCGVAVEMNYGPYGSGASSYAVPEALVNYFGYARDIEYRNRKLYSYSEWLSMLKAEIDALRPVYYSAHSETGGGHAFLIDGYNTDGYFHVNWGWGGLSDGYYQIATLIPDDGQGAGAGFDDGYAYSQCGIFNVHIPVGGETEISRLSARNFGITDLDGNAVSTLDVAKGGRFGMSFDEVQNLGILGFSGKLGYVIRDDNGNNVHESLPYNISEPLPSLGYYLQLRLTATMPSTLGDGHYRIYPAYAANGATEPQIMLTNVIGNGYADVAVQGSNATLTMPETLIDKLTLDNLIVRHNDQFLNSNECVTIEVDITNHGSEYYSGTVYALLLNSSGMVAYPAQDTHYTLPSNVIVPPGETKTMYLYMLINDFDRSNDVYYIAVTDDNFGRLLGNYRAAININNPEIAVKGEPEVIDGNSANLTVAAAFENLSPSMSYAGQIGAMVCDADGKSIRMLDVRQVEMAAGKESGIVTFNGSFPEGTVGERYLICFYDDSTPLYPPLEFVKEPAGVGNAEAAKIAVYPNPVSQLLNVTAATAIERVAIYGTDGKQVGAYSGDGSSLMQIDMGGLSRGIYLVRIASDNGVETVKVIKN